MKSAWTGDSSDAASTSLSALQEAFTVSSENLHTVSRNMNTQGDSFTKVKYEVGPGPGPKPEETFAGKYLPMFTDNDEQIERWNAEAARVVEVYNSYAKNTNENARTLPSSYGELTGSPEGLKFSVDEPGSDGGGKRVGDGFQGRGPGGSTSPTGHSPYNPGSPYTPSPTGPGTGIGTSPSSGTAGGSGGPGGSGAPGGPGGFGGTLPAGGQSGSTPGLPPGAVRLPDGSIRYPDGSIRTPDGRLIPPGSTRASSRDRGFGPGGGGSGGGGFGGAGGAAAAGMMGGGMMGGAAGGGDAAGGARSGFGPGGAGAGAAAGMGGAKAMGGGMGAGMGRGMGMGGMMGGAGARGGGGDDEKEHKDEYYVKQEMDPGLKTETDEYGEKLVDESTGMTVVPPVIGE